MILAAPVTGRLIQQEVGAFEIGCIEMEETIFCMIGEFSAELFKTDDTEYPVCGDIDLIATGFRDESLAEARQLSGPASITDPRSCPLFLRNVSAVQVIDIDIISLEDAGIALWPFHFLRSYLPGGSISVPASRLYRVYW